MAKAKGSLEKIAIGNKTDTLQWKDGKGENVTQVTCVTFKTETYTDRCKPSGLHRSVLFYFALST